MDVISLMALTPVTCGIVSSKASFIAPDRVRAIRRLARVARLV